VNLLSLPGPATFVIFSLDGSVCQGFDEVGGAAAESEYVILILNKVAIVGLRHLKKYILYFKRVRSPYLSDTLNQ
jgi:hypothetical protein